MRTRTITINIPRWIPTRHQWVKWKKKIKLFFHPPRCYSCNCKLPVEYPIYFKYRTGHHMGYDNIQSEFAVNAHWKKLCAPCLKQYIHKLNLPKSTCDLCQTKNVPTIDYHHSKGMVITFLWHWWNGRNYCLTCVDDLLDTGKVKNAY
jgi:hypothetical protein